MAMDVYFFTGTGTDVGKTYCASRFAETSRAAGKRVGVYKPAASGCEIGSDGELIARDAEHLWESAGRPLTLHTVCPQRFKAAIAPPEAAKEQGDTIDEVAFFTDLQPWIELAPDVLIIEGAGGLFSPLSDSMLNVDFALQLRERLPEMKTVLVAANRLGVIHDCIACVHAANAAGLSLDRILLNAFATDDSAPCDESLHTNAPLVQRWTGCPVVEHAEGLVRE
ncbi:dethiobiotin synthase [Rhodopirellula sp. SWK7]|uniref:dethiobiotin synthase n=1 Tax=Rhodopirellula sp. SWK7 TaxID=595460 RepID=UPI0002BE155A|nr:dethiobiotin synthase [Rhodopirellula sp. SWK7]EMI43700.1 dethiobiotin synthase [Rhodopirellula sp. SWK7]